MTRRFLFVQGHATPFYLRLGQELAAQGHGVAKINVSGGDRAFWGEWNAVDFRAPMSGLAGFVAETLARQDITDLVVYNDCRPCNAVAIAQARKAGIRVHVFEEGYLRPNWLTLERDGVNGHSRLPRDPQWYLCTAADLPPFDPGQPVGAGLRERILYDFRWQWANYRHRLRYPHYRTHRPYPIWAEYSTWAIRLAGLKIRAAQARAVVARLAEGDRPCFVFPLQLDSDTQIRLHSPFGRMTAAIETVIGDFARHAPGDAMLVIKNHPLDNGWIGYGRRIAQQALALGVSDRVIFIDGGDLGALLRHARGVVTVNSTVGLTALDNGVPVIALGKAIFDVPGLTFTGPLAAFWHAPERPDPALLDAFRRVVLHGCLVNGNFYTEQGMRLGIANSVARLCSSHDPLTGQTAPA